MTAALFSEFATGRKVEVFPGEDWPTSLPEGDPQADTIKFKECDGWFGFWRLWWSLSRQLGGKVRAGEDNEGRYFIQFIPGGWHDPV